MALKQTGDRGARKVEIPDLTGMTREQAQAALTYKGLAYSETNENTSTEADGTKIKAGTQTTGTVLIGSTVSYTYFTYVYPGFYHGFSHYGSFYHGFYHGFGHYGSFGHYGGFYHGFSHGGGYGLNVSSSPWVGVNLNINAQDGYIVPSNLEVSTIVNTVNIEELVGLSDPTWLNSSTITISPSTTVVSEVSQAMAEKLYVINGNHYSPNYYILVKKNDTYSFTNIKEIDEAYKVYSFSTGDFIDVTSTEEVAYIDMAYTIKCEPNNLLIVNDLVIFDKPAE